MIKRSFDLMKKSSSLYATTLPDLETKGIAAEEICFQFIKWPWVTICSKSLWEEASQNKSPPCQACLPCQVFSVILEKIRDQRTLGLYGRNLLIVYSYSAKFNSYTHSGIGYIIILVCHVIWQDHVIIWPCNLLFNILGSLPLSSVTILLSLEGRRVGGKVTLRAGAH